MRLQLFFKLLVASTIISLVVFALTPEASFLSLLKYLALGAAISIAIPAVYPDVRGVQKGDSVVVNTSSLPFFAGKFGIALSGGRKDKEIRIRFDDGEEAVGIIESYSGLLSPPKIKIIYEEKLIE